MVLLGIFDVHNLKYFPFQAASYDTAQQPSILYRSHFDRRCNISNSRLRSTSPIIFRISNSALVVLDPQGKYEPSKFLLKSEIKHNSSLRASSYSSHEPFNILCCSGSPHCSFHFGLHIQYSFPDHSPMYLLKPGFSSLRHHGRSEFGCIQPLRPSQTRR